MNRHPFDPVSAALGLLAGVAAVLVVGSSYGVVGEDWVRIAALAALLIGIALIPWQLSRRPEPDAITNDESEPESYRL